MFLDQYHAREGNIVRITAEQGSRFAKDVAGDHNPLHDADSRRFCVPGDLLCALVLSYYGLSARMTFHFRGMVGDRVPLDFPDDPGAAFDIADANGKVYLHVERSGPSTTDRAAVEGFIRHYVAFSGDSFPHYLTPLLAERGVMFNPDRPFVIYDSMGFDLEHVGFCEPELELGEASMDARGKRADASLGFRIRADGQPLGSGAKKLVISGLREYDEAQMKAFITRFTERKEAYEQSRDQRPAAAPGAP